MTTPTPLPCPFCGHPEPTTTHAAVDGAWTWGAITCTNEPCEAMGPWMESKADAVAAWNKPQRPTQPDHMAERLRNARRRGRRMLARRRSR